jgi:hypothetical protein
MVTYLELTAASNACSAHRRSFSFFRVTVPFQAAPFLRSVISVICNPHPRNATRFTR